MSSETHADAEETIRYFIGNALKNQEMFRSMALETMMFSRFLVYSGIEIFIRACLGYALSFSLPETEAPLRDLQHVVNNKILEIAPHIGALPEPADTPLLHPFADAFDALKRGAPRLLPRNRWTAPEICDGRLLPMCRDAYLQSNAPTDI
jgi:hypothetical protein